MLRPRERAGVSGAEEARLARWLNSRGQHLSLEPSELRAEMGKLRGLAQLLRALPVRA